MHKQFLAMTPDLSWLMFFACVSTALVFAIGSAFLPGNPAFCTLLIWICALTMAEIVHYVSKLLL